MLTVDRISIRAPAERVFQVAADIERWPRILAHYRWVRFLERDATGGGGGGVVEMAAWRPFGPVRYPAWWVSQMTVNGAAGHDTPHDVHAARDTDRKSTRLNSSHLVISYAVFCLKKK